ncbi:MAG: glycosyltransferase family 39 protein [Nanoarchaeota archaeon]|mgnify:FL=1
MKINLLKKLKNINLEYYLLGLILIFALFLRVYALGSPPMWIDETISAVASKNIIEHGVPVFDSGASYGRAYLFHYLEAFFILFSQSDFNARIISVIFGILTVLFAYFIGKEYSKSGGLISALFMAVFYLEVFYSRQARFYQLFQLMFFLSLFLLYKSKDKKYMIWPALVCFFITINTQVAGLVLVPFFFIHILMYNRKHWYLSIIVLIPAFIHLVSVLAVTSGVDTAVNYISWYSGYTSNIQYLFILLIPGIIWGFFKNKRLTLLIVVPSLMLLFGILFVKLFALRYMYFFVLPMVLYSSLLMAFLYDKYGKWIMLSIIILLIFPSNLIFPYTYVNVIKPIDYNYRDFSAPEINYKTIPAYVVNELKDGKIMTFFSPGVEWYIDSPDYVFPYSMNGIGTDTISYNGKDVYSGAIVTTERPSGEFYFVADNFGLSKLRPSQKDKYDLIVKGCENLYSNRDLAVWHCK